MVINKDSVLSFLKANPVMSIAINGDWAPISSVVIFAVDNDLSIYFLTHESSFKAKALEKNNRISLSVWQKGNMLVQASGNAEIIKDEEEENKVIDRIVNSSEMIQGLWPPLISLKQDKYRAYVIKPEWLRVLDLSNQTIKGQDQIFTKII